LTPAKVKVIPAKNQNYNVCTAEATKQVAAGRQASQDLPKAFARCLDKYPSAGLFLQCKKNAFLKSKGQAPSAPALAECKALLTAANFDGVDPAPIYVNEQDAFFGGIGLNQELKISDMKFPNFTCEKFDAAILAIPKLAQHILFGNHPLMFLRGAEQKKYISALAAISSKKKKADKFSDISGFGRLFSDSHGKSEIVYFPSAPCDFRGSLGEAYSGMSVYYLPDVAHQTATPYFGIAYYRRNQKSLTTPKLVAEVLSRMGSRYKAYAKDAQTVFISSSPFSEVDKERDPRNICMEPRPQRFVVAIYSSKDDTSAPEYLLLANIRNLCDYGDRQARMLVR
jgi:hypothetical protein